MRNGNIVDDRIVIAIIICDGNKVKSVLRQLTIGCCE